MPFSVTQASRSALLPEKCGVYWPVSIVFALALAAAFACHAADRPRLHPLPKQAQNPKTGPAPGSPIPPFDAVDQNGRRQTFDSLRGPKGLVLQFDRSAD